MDSWRGTWIGIMPLLWLVGAPGCDRSQTPARAEGGERRIPADETTAAGAPSPVAAARRLHALHLARDYDGMADFIVDDRREPTLALLKAIDAVIDAHATLHKAAMAAYDVVPRETWTLAAMEDNLGPFSTRVRWINQAFKGTTATVTLQEGENIPLVHAAFVFVDGRWRYRPEPTPRRMVAELRVLADVLRDVEQSVRRGAPFESYVDAFMVRVLPQMSRVVTARDDTPEETASTVGRRP